MLRLLIFLAALAVVSPSLFAQTFQGTGSFSLGMSTNASNATLPAARGNLLPLNVTSIIYAKDVTGAVSGQLCTWDGQSNHDVGDCINGAIAAAVAGGGGRVILPPGSYYFSRQIFNAASANGLQIAGQSTTLHWNGAIDGNPTMLFQPAYGSTSDTRMWDFALTGITLDANNDQIGLEVLSMYKCNIDNVTVENTTTHAVDFGAVPAVPGTTFSASDTTSMQGCMIDNLNLTNFSGDGFYADVYIDNVSGIEGNFSDNKIRHTEIEGSNSSTTAFHLKGADNNIFEHARAYPTTATSIDLDIMVNNSGPFSTFSYPANGNLFWDAHPHGAVIARGQTTYPSCATYSSFSTMHGSCTIGNFVQIDTTNTNPTVTIEPGAWMPSQNTLYSEKSNTIAYGTGLGPASLGLSSTSIERTCLADTALYGANAGYYACLGGGQYGMIFDEPVGTDIFGIKTTSHTLVFSAIAGGTGGYSFTGGPMTATGLAGIGATYTPKMLCIDNTTGAIYKGQQTPIQCAFGGFASTADNAINTTTTTSCIGNTGVGNRSILTTEMVVGTRIELRCRGIYTTPAANTATLAPQVFFGTTVIGTATAMPASMTNAPFDFDVLCTLRSIGASGSAECDGMFAYSNAGALNEIQIHGTTTIDTTAARTPDLMLTWSSVAGGQTMTSSQAGMELR